MGLKRTEEFRRDAVRIALTSGLKRKQVADDLGVGMSTLNKWITAHAKRAAERLRQHGLVAGTMTVFFYTNRHRQDRPQYADSRSTQLTQMSSDKFDLVGAGKRCALAAWPNISAPS